MSDHGFSHLDADGRAHMVDVTAKDVTKRTATATGRVRMTAATAAALAAGGVGKGDVLAVARVAGIQAAKRTSDLIPLCHPLMIGSVSVEFELGDDSVGVSATVQTVDRTGVEMEALTAVSVACLTIFDMCKALDKTMVIAQISVAEKDGGRSGRYERPGE